MKHPNIPTGFLSFSDAVNRLANGMWGGLPRPVPVAILKHTNQKSSVGFGPWGESAGRRLTAAAVSGEPVVYVFAEFEPLAVPADVLERLMTVRGSLLDHPFRPSIKAAGGDKSLLASLTVGLLVVRESDFNAWYRSERTKGKWASQRSRQKAGDGRPTKQTEPLRNAVLALVHDGVWSGKAGVTKLHRLLTDSGRSDIPSPDTLTRLVDQMHHETGEAALLRTVRRRRKPT